MYEWYSLDLFPFCLTFQRRRKHGYYHDRHTFTRNVIYLDIYIMRAKPDTKVRERKSLFLILPFLLWQISPEYYMQNSKLSRHYMESVFNCHDCSAVWACLRGYLHKLVPFRWPGKGVQIACQYNRLSFLLSALQLIACVARGIV